MIKSVEERVADLIEQEAIEAKQRFYVHHNVESEVAFWANPVGAIKWLIQQRLPEQKSSIQTFNQHDDGSLCLVHPDLARIQVTAEILSQFKSELINVHGAAVFSKPFKETTNFDHFYLQHLWNQLESGSEWTCFDTLCEATRWDNGKMRFEEVPAYKLQHIDGTSMVLQLPQNADALIRVFYFNVPVELQRGLNGIKRFRQLFNMLLAGTNHPAMTSPCLIAQDNAAPIGDRPEWRFTPCDDGIAEDVTRLMRYWFRCGATRPMFDGEPRDMLWFANPNHALKFKELLAEATGVNPYNLISKRHSIYDEEFAGKLKCD